MLGIPLELPKLWLRCCVLHVMAEYEAADPSAGTAAARSLATQRKDPVPSPSKLSGQTYSRAPPRGQLQRPGTAVQQGTVPDAGTARQHTPAEQTPSPGPVASAAAEGQSGRSTAAAAASQPWPAASSSGVMGIDELEARIAALNQTLAGSPLGSLAQSGRAQPGSESRSVAKPGAVGDGEAAGAQETAAAGRSPAWAERAASTQPGLSFQQQAGGPAYEAGGPEAANTSHVGAIVSMSEAEEGLLLWAQACPGEPLLVIPCTSRLQVRPLQAHALSLQLPLLPGDNGELHTPAEHA